MACNLAVSITKAAVNEEQLLKLLTPEAVQPVVESYLRQPGVLKAGETFNVSRQGNRLIVTVGSLRLFIDGGRVSTYATQGYNDGRGRELVDALSNLLALAADALFAQKVKAALAPFGKVAQQQVTVDNGGVTQAATVFTLKI
ncbi:hypothetical protein [Chloroflexus sp.]|uniref:hypothetical protein n=1 Tax=Chloroflexus sp. TaxID=1904827 RepID=UPI002ACED452|nr:hypothetical protein [Chloroflexus sp.]